MNIHSGMDRLEALKTLALASGALVTLPSWAMGWNDRNLLSYSSDFTPDEQALIANIADTIIPENDSIGALSVGVDKFLIRLIDQCYEDDVKKNVKTRLKALNGLALNTSGDPFGACRQQKREELLLTFSNSADEADKNFFNLMKSETIRGFRTSQVVMEDYLGYQVIPDYYNGFVDVNDK